ncbi:YbhB/YbcL family Raf kinase inhibitor-like protein [Enterococcus avium]
MRLNIKNRVLNNSKKFKIISILLILIGIAIAVIIFLRPKDIQIDGVRELKVTSPAFKSNALIPVKYTGDGKDVSPELRLSNLDKKAVSLAVIMDDIDVPVRGIYNHWVIWNLPVSRVIPAEIPNGKQISELDNAVQGIGYGEHCYRGPKPPFGSHRYKYHVFVLNKRLDLPSSTNREELLEAMSGSVLQHGFLLGEYAGKK